MDIRLETLIKLGYDEEQIRKINIHSELYQLKFDMHANISNAISEMKNENYSSTLVILSETIKQLSSDGMSNIMKVIFDDQRFVNSYECLVDKLFGTHGLIMRCAVSGPAMSSDLREIFDNVVATIRNQLSYGNVYSELMTNAIDYSEKLLKVSGYIKSFRETIYLNYHNNKIASHHEEVTAISGMHIISFLYDVIGIIERKSDDIIKEIKNNKKEESIENGETE